MAQLKDTVVAGSLRATEGIYTNEIQCTKLKALTSASATTNYGVGTNGQILMSNGTNAYWSSDIPAAAANKIGGIQLGFNTSYTSSGVLNVKVSADNNNAYVSLSSFTTTSYGFGLVPKPGSSDSGKFLRGDGTWQTVSTSGTTTAELTVATVNALGGIQLYSSTETIAESNSYRLRVDSSSYKAYVVIPTFTGTTRGLVPASSSTETTKFLRSDGEWATIDTSGSGSGSGTTSISAATDSALGGIKIGYSNTGNNFAVELATNTNKAYVTVPSASRTSLGLINTSTQGFGGKKTFWGGAIIGDNSLIGTDTETSYTLYGTGLLKGTSTTIQTDLLKICNKNASSSYITGQPYKWAIQLGTTLVQPSQGDSCPAITLSEDYSGGLQIKASRILLTRNTYQRYNEEGIYSSGDIVWFSSRYYKNNNGLNDYITNTTNWTEIPLANSIVCDSAFIPFIDKKYSLGSSTNSWSALYLNGYKIQCVNGNLTIT